MTFDPSGVSEIQSQYSANQAPFRLAYNDKERGLYLYQGNCLDVMEAILRKYPDGCFDMIFADPPYGLSNGGFTCQAGQMAEVDKGAWDRFGSSAEYAAFTHAWLRLCQMLLRPDGTIWVSGTRHNIYTIGFIMTELGFKILNDIVWEKPNPPPNLSCRYFTHSVEHLIWAAKNDLSKHCFNYSLMKREAGGRQMKTVWRLSPPSRSEKLFGKHPTQKPIKLLDRIIIASTIEGGFVFDPFCGSATTGVAARIANRRFCGVEINPNYIRLSAKRLAEEK